MTLNDILTDIKAQLEWRGPGGHPQGNVVIPRKDAQELVERLQAIAGLIEQIGRRDQQGPLTPHRERNNDP